MNEPKFTFEEMVDLIKTITAANVLDMSALPPLDIETLRKVYRMHSDCESRVLRAIAKFCGISDADLGMAMAFVAMERIIDATEHPGED